MIDMQKLLDDLELIEQVIPDYSAGRRMGMTDTESENVVAEVIEKTISALEKLQEQNEVLADTVNMLSPLMMENRELKEKQMPKPIDQHHSKFHYGKCPSCGRLYWDKNHVSRYCDMCGQRLEVEQDAKEE